MLEQFVVTPIEIGQLVAKASEMLAGGYRLVQICCTRTKTDLELTYSFDKEYKLLNFRFSVLPGVAVPSISTLYWCAFTYENEIHDLFDIPITDIALDFKGTFYRTATKAAFAAAPGEAQ